MSFNAQSFQGLINVLEDQRYSIARCCQAVEECLLSNRDNLRGFFEQCFSLLLKQVFGYEGSSWLNSIAKNGLEADAKALVGLLSPSGPLFRAIQAADADRLIKFEFPLSRLPTHSQQLIRLEPGRAQLERWPQYAGHIVTDARGACHVHLNVYEYFVFWTAFYVLRSSQVSGTYFSQAPQERAASLAPSLGTVRKALGVHRERPHALRHPYLRMLQQYLEHFLPRAPPLAGVPPSPRRGFASPGGQRGGGGGAAGAGRVLFSVLTEFWLTDGDEPLPASLAGQARAETREAWPDAGGLRVRSYQPPGEDLLEALALLVRYVTAAEDGRTGAVRPAQAGSWLPATPCDAQPLQQGRGAAPPARLGAHASPPAQAFARRLFRFLLRAFRCWPEQHATAPLLHLWLAFAAPWWGRPGGGDAGGWEAHALCALPFYSALLPALLDLLAGRVSSRGDAALDDLVKVLGVLRGSPQLLQLLRTAEGDLARYGQAGRRPEGPFADALPWLLAQRQDWSAFAAAGQGAGAPQEVGEAGAASLFGTDQGGAGFRVRELLAAAAGAARPELVREAAAAAAAVLPLDRLAPAASGLAPASSQPLAPIQGLRRGAWHEVRYKGDYMRRPLASSEIGWLVRLLLALSDAANAWLRLDQPPPPADAPLPPGLQGLGARLRARRWRVNLRPLGEVQTLCWLPLCCAALWLWLRLLLLLGAALTVAAPAGQ